MQIALSSKFKKNFKKRAANKKSKRIFEERLKLFKENRNNPLLDDHGLDRDLKGYRSFSITGDIRVIYEELESDTYYFIDYGTHNQVY